MSVGQIPPHLGCQPQWVVSIAYPASTHHVAAAVLAGRKLGTNVLAGRKLGTNVLAGRKLGTNVLAGRKLGTIV